MKKILNNIFKWALLVWISFALIFTAICSMEQGGLIQAIAYKVHTIDEPAIYQVGSLELQEYCEYYQEMADKSIGNDYNVPEEIDGEYRDRELELKGLYKKYPVGVIMFFREFGEMESISDLYIISLMMGIVVGTAIYLMLDKDKKGLRVVIALYILFILLLGFVEGIGSVAGDNITLLDRWMFPETYIIPVTIMFTLVVIVRFLRQKDIANKLNEKLKESKKEKSL